VKITTACLKKCIIKSGFEKQKYGKRAASFTLYIQCGNFNWNKIHKSDIGDFCKKSRNRLTFVFPCPHFGAYGFCISGPGSVQPPLTFFFQM
jgi:hypothetical protein